MELVSTETLAQNFLKPAFYGFDEVLFLSQHVVAPPWNLAVGYGPQILFGIVICAILDSFVAEYRC